MLRLTTPELDEELLHQIDEASQLFDEVCQDIHSNDKSDVIDRLTDDNLSNALSALAQAANAIRYEFIRLVLTTHVSAIMQESTLGGEAFQRVGKDWGNVRDRKEWGTGPVVG